MDTPRGMRTYYLIKFSQKLHENNKILQWACIPDTLKSIACILGPSNPSHVSLHPQIYCMYPCTLKSIACIPASLNLSHVSLHPQICCMYPCILKSVACIPGTLRPINDDKSGLIFCWIFLGSISQNICICLSTIEFPQLLIKKLILFN